MSAAWLASENLPNLCMLLLASTISFSNCSLIASQPLSPPDIIQRQHSEQQLAHQKLSKFVRCACQHYFLS
jgi:hypothetical protein